MPNFQVIKIFWKEIGCTFFAEVRARIRGNYPRIFTFLWIRKRKPTSIKPDQKILAKFSYPKNPGMEHFKPPKIIRSSPSLEIRSGEWRKVNENGKKLRERRGRGELREGTFAVSLSPPPTPLLFFLLTPLCPVPTTRTPGNLVLVLPLGKRNDQFKMNYKLWSRILHCSLSPLICVYNKRRKTTSC